MIKKAIALIMIVCTLSLVACKEKTQIEKAQDRIVEIGKQYLNYELTADEAKEKLDSIIIPDIEGNEDLYLTVDRDALSYYITKSKVSRSSLSDVEKQLENIRNQKYN